MFERYPELREVLVHTRTDRTFRGTLWRKRRGYLILKQATLIAQNRVALDGETVIPADNVDFIQVVT